MTLALYLGERQLRNSSEETDKMAATPLFTCTCGVQKKTSNHWILAITSTHDVKFMPWDANLALEDNVIVLCGERCAAALLSRCLGDWKASEYTDTPVTARVAAKTPAAATTAAA